jgi:hypothetical protein
MIGYSHGQPESADGLVVAGANGIVRV